jgi:hypothetical protein
MSDPGVKTACLAVLERSSGWLGAREIASALHMALNPAPVALALHELWSARAIQRITVPTGGTRLLYARLGLARPKPEQILPPARLPYVPRQRAPRLSAAPRLFSHAVEPDGSITIAGEDGFLLAIDFDRAQALRYELGRAIREAKR